MNANIQTLYIIQTHITDLDVERTDTVDRI